jgi:hypothetical protein
MLPERTIDRFAIAARLRALMLSENAVSTPSAMAQSLGVRESTLRASIDEESPRPWVEVVLAVVRRFGVDPTWILTGVYDSATHRAALEDEGNAERLLSRTMLARERKSHESAIDLVHRSARSEARQRHEADRDARGVDQ